MSRFTREQFNQILAKPGYNHQLDAENYASMAAGVRHAQPEPVDGPEPLCDDAAQAQGSGRIVVCITRYSTGTLDRDNLWGGAKAVCDALRYSGFIPDDDPASIFLYVRQQKCKAQDKGTEILIIPVA